MFPYGNPQQPFIIIPQVPPQGSGDPIDQMEKALKFAKRMRDEDKEDSKKDKKDADKKGLSYTEWLMVTIAASSIINTLVVLWMVRGK